MNNNTTKKMLLVPIGFKFKPSNNQCLQYLEAQLCGWTLSDLPNIVEKDLYADHPSVIFGPDDNPNADEYKESNKVCFVRYFYTTLQKKAKEANYNGSRYIRVVEGGLGTWLNQKSDNIFNDQGNPIGLRRYYKFKPKSKNNVGESKDDNVEWKMYEFCFVEGFMPKGVLKGREDMVLCKIIKEVKIDQVVKFQKQQGQVLINNPWITSINSNNKRVVEQSFGGVDNVDYEQSPCKKQAIEKTLDYNDGSVLVHGNSGLDYDQAAAWCNEANDGSFSMNGSSGLDVQTCHNQAIEETIIDHDDLSFLLPGFWSLVYNQAACSNQAIDYNDGSVLVHRNSGLNNQIQGCYNQAIEKAVDYNDGSFYPSLEDHIQAQTQTRLFVDEEELANSQFVRSAINSKPFTYYDEQAPNPGNNDIVATQPSCLVGSEPSIIDDATWNACGSGVEGFDPSTLFTNEGLSEAYQLLNQDNGVC